MILRCAGFGLVRQKPLLLMFLWLIASNPANAQVRPDSIRRDTARDSARVIADSAKPPLIIVKHSAGTPAGFATAVWEWNHTDLLREAAVTLTDLLQQLPGMAPFRVGLFLQPEVISPLGQTRGRIQIWLDGYELDPLTEASYDLSRIELANLERVRVERRLDLTRIEITTLEAVDARPQSRIEAGVGEPDVNLFRAVFIAPRLLVGPLGFTIERVDTDGLGRRENADVFNGWLKWGWIHSRIAVQAEFRQSSFTRNPESPWPGESKRRDVMLRVRAPLVSGLVAEAFAGKSSFENDTTLGNPPVDDSVTISKPKADVMQYGARVSFESQYIWADLTARLRNHDALPTTQIDAQVGARFATFGGAIASWSHAAWRDAGGAASYDLRAYAGPFAGVTAFAELAGGKRGGPKARFVDTLSVFTGERTATRLGVALSRWGIQASGALLQIDSDSVQSFGLAFDSTDLRFQGADLTGWEFAGSVPLYFRTLTVHGQYTTWPSGRFPLYVPNQLWRTALQFHALPLPSGNLEVLARVELRRRGSLIAPQLNADEEEISWTAVALPAQNQVDGYFQLRIMDVRLFIRGENFININEGLNELPGRTINTARFMYGVKWDFKN
ncbi:MAG: Plug domain-containing protein [Gemmatimonadota bacterium]